MNASLRENHLTLIYLLESGLVTVDDIIPAAPEPATLPTWHELVALEPALDDLIREARASQGLCWSCRWYGRIGAPGLKQWVIRLVGHQSRHPEPLMHTSSAYDVAYQTVLAAVPDGSCRWCGPSDEEMRASEEAEAMDLVETW
jgi:hypothetical protein